MENDKIINILALINSWHTMPFIPYKLPEMRRIALEGGPVRVTFNKNKFLVERKEEGQRTISEIIQPYEKWENVGSSPEFHDGKFRFISNIGNLPGYEEYHPRCFDCYFGKFFISNPAIPDVRYLVYSYDEDSIHTVTKDLNTEGLTHVNIAYSNLDSYTGFFA